MNTNTTLCSIRIFNGSFISECLFKPTKCNYRVQNDKRKNTLYYIQQHQVWIAGILDICILQLKLSNVPQKCSPSSHNIRKIRKYWAANKTCFKKSDRSWSKNDKFALIKNLTATLLFTDWMKSKVDTWSCHIFAR